MSAERKAEILDAFFSEIMFMFAGSHFVEVLEEAREPKMLIAEEYRETLNPLIELLTREELAEMCRDYLPVFLTKRLGAKEVLITW